MHFLRELWPGCNDQSFCIQVKIYLIYIVLEMKACIQQNFINQKGGAYSFTGYGKHPTIYDTVQKGLKVISMWVGVQEQAN